ncbi:DUF885 domain-containing protein [Kineobactrum salinum]|uniref:DUF885 domain-containing protein n=1 Tax=Kineobactrum salinum TaxID=2708301 RepID=A0A6C0TXA3_9GAMM|nr:DUF885 domain-containing protein [Kineobactrum salinum]QIB64153.1 DUF885 domain-containing protein [Kineobactrum salinum]
MMGLQHTLPAAIRGLTLVLLLTVASGNPARAEPSSPEARLAEFMAGVHQYRQANRPELAGGAAAMPAGSGWPDLSAAAEEADIAVVRRQLAALREDFEPAALGPGARTQYDALVYELELLLERHHWRSHLFPVNQIVGTHLEIPGRLARGGPVDSTADLDALLRDLAAVPRLLAQLEAQLERQRDSAGGLPASLYPRLIEGARQVISGAPFDERGDNPVWSSVRERLQQGELDTTVMRQYLQRIRSALLGPYRQAYRSLIDTLEEHQLSAGHDGGVWQMPEGDAFYAFLLRQFTTTELSADEIHAYGLAEVTRIHAAMQTIMRTVEFDGELPEFFEFMRSSPQFYLANDAQGRVQLLARARELYQAMAERLPELVFEPPRQALEIRRFEEYREQSAPGAFYEAGAAGRAARFYLNLHDMATVATYDLEALVYHETVPGHHLQISAISADPAIPALRQQNVWWLNSAFVEGWALYAEQLAHDIGFYQDVYSDFGRLAAELWRACRLVVDTGLHAKRWSRDEAIRYLDDTTPSPHMANVRAVDRYIAVPGQATSFKIGMRRILEARERARDALGNRFDLRAFHQAVLANGYVPLDVMDRSIDRWVRRSRAGLQDDASGTSTPSIHF